MVREEFCGLILLAGLAFLIGFPIWAGIYFGIYYPFQSRDWQKTTCQITAVNEYKTYAILWHTYIQIKLQVQIEGQKYPGFACQSNYRDSPPAGTEADNAYPYQYVRCENYDQKEGDNCQDGQLFLPRWICGPLGNGLFHQIGDTVECKWWLNDPDGDTNPKGKSLSYPKQGKSFIEVTFYEGQYVPTDPYNALWVIPFGIMSVFPCIVIWCVGIPGYFEVCSREKRERYMDCIDKYVLCRRNFIPRNIRNLQWYGGSFFEKLIPILYVMYLSKKQLNFKPILLRKIGRYIDN